MRLGFTDHGAAACREQEGLMDRITLDRGTLGKAFGVVGGYITGSSVLCDFIRSFAVWFYLYDSSCHRLLRQPRGRLSCTLKASDSERAAPARTGRETARWIGPCRHSAFGKQSHIVPVMIKDPVKTKMLADYLMDEWGIYVQPINYPTVPKGTERLRFTPSPLHSDADIAYLVEALESLWKQCAIAHAVA